MNKKMKKVRNVFVLSTLATYVLLISTPKIISELTKNEEEYQEENIMAKKAITLPTINPAVFSIPTINPLDIFTEVNQYAYVKYDTYGYDGYKEDKNASTLIEAYQKVFVLGTNREFYNVCDEYGITYYIPVSELELIPKDFIDIDISDQRLLLYEDNNLYLDCNIVTGKPSTPSDIGYFEIYEKTYNRPLIGPDYNVPVNYFFPYNGGEGLHDASWRSEFGGNIYEYDGSHGCINMRLEDVEIIDTYAKEGTKVLVHK